MGREGGVAMVEGGWFFLQADCPAWEGGLVGAPCFDHLFPHQALEVRDEQGPPVQSLFQGCGTDDDTGIAGVKHLLLYDDVP